MQPYQLKYIENTEKIAALGNMFVIDAPDFEGWAARRREAQLKIALLREENTAALKNELFVLLDALAGADEESIRDLESFGDRLMDWKTNLDCGVYLAIHEALLRLYRVRKDRNGVIRELYKSGMGLYYLSRPVNSVEGEQKSAIQYRNELLFQEASSWLPYFEEIEDQDTRGYIIRSIANVSLCTGNRSRRIAAGVKTLNIIRDGYYRSLAPGLPWDAFLRKTHQQMSTNRTVFSRGNLSKEELAAVLDSCYEVFSPEQAEASPSVRWLWPYYEMEYSLGYVSLESTLERLENLIYLPQEDDYNMSGLYAHVQLPIYYGQLMMKNPRLTEEPARVSFLSRAYRKMLNVLMSCPADRFDDYFFFNIDLVITGYYETPGVPDFRSAAVLLMRRFGGALYLRSRRAADLMRCLCGAIYDGDPRVFDDIPFISALPEDESKRASVVDYAAECGFFADFGLLKMNILRTAETRMLFEGEYEMYKLHTVSGHDDLVRHPSTERFADIALGHHMRYDGLEGYPENYVRNRSSCRIMCDAAAAVSWLLEKSEEGKTFNGETGAVGALIKEPAGRFSPLVTAAAADKDVAGKLELILSNDGNVYYREIYTALMGQSGDSL